MSHHHHTHLPRQNTTPLCVAVSACLLGHEVRYDGGQKRHDFVADSLAKWLKLLPICPEVEAGLGVPRPPVHLVQLDEKLEAIGVADPSLIVTQQLTRFGMEVARRLQHVDGCIFKARSPSCGVNSTPIKCSNGRYRKGAGLFAAQIMECLPLLPVVEERQLESPAQQINFLQRIVAYRHWREFVGSSPGWDRLIQFHQANYLLLLAHGVEGVRSLDNWIVDNQRGGRISHARLQEYGVLYMSQFRHQATQRRQVVVLKRIARMSVESQALQKWIADFESGHMPLEALMQKFRGQLCGQMTTDAAVENYLKRCADLDFSGLIKSNT